MGKRKPKTRLHGEVLAFFQKIGARGGKTRAQKYDAKQLSEWAKKGGRPKMKKSGEAPAA